MAEKETCSTSTKPVVRSDHLESIIQNSKEINDKFYNPYEYRVVDHPNSFLGAFLHLVKSSLGTGILAVPRAFKSAGLLVGLFGTIIVGMLCTHTVYILVKTSQKVCSKARIPSLGYADTAGEVFKQGPQCLKRWSRFAKAFVEIALISTYYLSNAVYMVFISVSLTKLFSYYYPDTASWDNYIFKLMMLGPLIVLCQIRELKHMVPFSFIANSMLIIAFSITGYYIFSGLSDIKLSQRNMSTNMAGIPSFFSTVLFAMEGIGTIMPVENSMIKPIFLGWHGVLNSAMTVIVFFFTSIGFFGYYRFGEDTDVTITKNLPSDEIPAQIAQAAISISVFFSFMLVFYVPVDITWQRIKHKIPESGHNIFQILMRIGLLLFITVIAIAGGEHLGSLIDLVGAVFFSTLGFFMPPLLDIIVDWNESWGTFHWRLIKNVLVMILAIFGLFSGTYYAILAIK